MPLSPLHRVVLTHDEQQVLERGHGPRGTSTVVYVKIVGRPCELVPNDTASSAFLGQITKDAYEMLARRLSTEFDRISTQQRRMLILNTGKSGLYFISREHGPSSVVLKFRGISSEQRQR